MKKATALLLALLMVLSLAACGDPANGNSGATTGQTESTTPDSGETGAPTEPEETEAPTEPVEDTPAFDTSWASNDFEALLPELPFSGWTTSQPDDSTYKMELIGLNTGAATNAPDSGEPDGADKQKLLDYLNGLSPYGFTVEEVGTDYMWEATDASGNKAEFMCGDGGCWITITKASAEPENDTPAFDTSWAGNEFESQLAEPEFENWKVSSHIEGQSWEIFVQAVHYDDVKAYAAELRSYGFADNESENDGFNGLAYIFEADNKNGYHAKMLFEAGDRDGNGSFTLKISK